MEEGDRKDNLTFVYDKSLTLVTIASKIDQNVALLDVDENVLADSLAVIHDNFINIIPILHPHRRSRYVSITGCDKDANESIVQVKWLKINNDKIFVVLSTLGLQVYDLQVNEVLFRHRCKESGHFQNYASGVCVVQNLLCVSTNLGAIWIFKPNETNTSFSLIGKHYAHDDPIDLLDGCDSFIVSCSEVKTYVWKLHRGDVEITRDIEVSGMNGYPTALFVCVSLIFIGYNTGEFCIFDHINEKVCIRAVAHMLRIVDIDFSLLKYFVLTASEDCYLKIWSFDQLSLKVECKFTLFNETGSFCGARFLNHTCTSFCTVTASDLEVKLYKSIEGGGDNGYSESVKFDEKFKENMLHQKIFENVSPPMDPVF